MSAPFLMMPVTLQGIKNTWAGKKLFLKLLAALAAQPVGHVYCWVSYLLPGPNSIFFGHQMFPKDLSGILGETTFTKTLYFLSNKSSKFCEINQKKLCVADQDSELFPDPELSTKILVPKLDPTLKIFTFLNACFLIFL